MQIRFQYLYIGTALAVLLVATALAYAPGLDGVFVFDSVERVARNDALRVDELTPRQLLAAAYGAQAHYPQRGLAYVSLALNYYFSGERFVPFAFKLTNLVIHLMNGLLVFSLAALVIARWRQFRIVDARRGPTAGVLLTACAVAGIWMLHPIQLTSVLYVVQRMTSLAATCVLAGAIVFVLARTRLEQGRSLALAVMYVGVVGFTLVGFLFKQNALLLPAFACVLELFVFDRRRLGAPQRRALRLFFVLTLLLPAIAAVVIVASGSASGSGGYAFRDFDMLQRALTQARVLLFYLGLLAVPDIRRFGLYHDDIAVSVGWLEPWTTAVAVLVWIAVAACAARGARRRAPWAFAIVWFLVGHAVESSILPLELAHEHRNYVPAVGVWMAVGYYAGVLWERAGRARLLVPCAMVLWIAAIGALTHARAETWRNPAELMASLARYHPGSYRSASGYAFNSVPRSADLGLRFDAFRRAALLNDAAVSPLIEMGKLAVALGLYLDDTEPPIAPLAGSDLQVADMQLRTDSGHNTRLLSAIDGEIARRLRHQRPRTDNVVALVSLVDCSLDGSRECVVLRSSAARWHASALSNERLPKNLEAALELSLAKLHAINGDDEEAVRHARRAGRAAGENFSYRLQEAVLYSLLERWEELDHALAEIEARFPSRARANPTFMSLRARFERNAIR